MKKWRVQVYYGLEHFPELDDPIHESAGRLSDFSGAGVGERDMGWDCESELGARRIYNAVKPYGRAEIREIEFND